VSISESPDLLNEGDFSDLIALATGWDIGAEELLNVGERIHTVERLFNALHASFSRKDDYPSRRFFREPIKSGPFAGEVVDKQEFDRMLDQNYAIHGWSRQGLPEMEVLKELGLLELLNRLPCNL
jgi:aldehyde:ferredoxin oxidoreductase